MIIYLWEYDSHQLVPTRSLRWDAAWTLLMPDAMGDVPPGYAGALALHPLTTWAWQALGRVAGRLRTPDAEPLWFVVPPLTPAAREYVIRIASFWADAVYTVRDMHHPEIHGDNLWLPPVVETAQAPLDGTLDRHLAVTDTTAQMRFFTAHMGFGRAAIGVDIISPGAAKGRLHSHSVVDEYYMVLQGTGTLRMGPHDIPVGPGALIGKPTGPDLTSHILADRGEAMTILDIEVWPEPGYQTKDVVHYADFGELMLRGSGWSAISPTDALVPTTDMRQHYEDGYWRNKDGSWDSKRVPGAPPRRASDNSTHGGYTSTTQGVNET